MSESSKEQLTSAVPTSITTESKSVVEEAPSNDLKLEETSQCINLPIETALEDDTVSKETLPTADVNVANKENLNESLTTSATSSGKAVSSIETSASDTQEDSCKENDTLSKKTLPTAESTTAVADVIVANKENLNESLTTSESSSGKAVSSTESKDILNNEHAKHVTYSEDGTAIYTDPKTNHQYKWCSKQNKWLQSDGSAATNAYENEHYRWCSESQKWIPKQTQVTETEHYKWNAEKNEWVAKVKQNQDAQPKATTDIVYDVDENGHRTYTDKDGMIFFWDVEKNAWFPKIDEDFMARYQMNYGFIDNTSESEVEKNKRDLELAVQKEKELAKLVEEAKASEEASKEANKSGLKRKQPPEPPKWFEIDPVHNTKVYVSNLPLDITLDEFTDVMGKCGMIMRDPQTQKYKLKLYTEADGQIKGDGLCDYIKVESVDLALKILDEYDLRGHKIRVQRAQFQMRGEYNPALKPKRKKKDKEKLAKIKEKLFDWRPEKMRGERSKHEKTVIIKNLFHPELFEKEVQLILDYQNDLREECSKCGTVRKVVIYDRHSEGVAQVNMSSPEEADLVIQMMQGRYFGKRQLTAEHWDGKTKYKIEETEEEIQKRLNTWDQYLEAEENKKLNLQQQQEEEKLDSAKDKQIETEVLDPIELN